MRIGVGRPKRRAGLISCGLIGVVAALGLVAWGGSTVQPKPNPVQRGAFSVDGQSRGYRVFRPPAVGSRPAPLVVLLHGCFAGATGERAA